MSRIKKWAKHNVLINGLFGLYRDYFCAKKGSTDFVRG